MAKRFLISLILVALLPAWGFATTWYIDYGSGADTNAGTSTSAAFKHCPGDSSATGTASSTMFSPGDHVIFRGGVTYSITSALGINVKWSGNANTDAGRITYDGDSGTFVPRWGTGTAQAIIDGGGASTTYYYAFYFNAVSYIMINSFEIQNQGASQTEDECAEFGAGSICDQNATNATNYVIISNNTIHDCGDVGTLANNYSDTSGGCVIFTGNNWAVYNNNIYNGCYVGIQVSGSNANVYNNNITDIVVWGLTVVSLDVQISNIQVHNNVIHDIKQISADINSTPHVDSIFSFAGGGSNGFLNLYIYDNLIYTNSNTPCVVPASCPSGYGATLQSWIIGVQNPANGVYIYNNVMSNMAPTNGYICPISDTSDGTGGTFQNLYIFNNSVADDGGYEAQPAQISGSVQMINLGTYNHSAKFSNVVIENNSLSTTSTDTNASLITLSPASDMSGVVINNNNYNIANTTPFQVGSTFYTLAQWQALGYDKTNVGGRTSNPLYTLANTTNWNLTPQSGSPLRGNGLNLTTEASTLGISSTLDYDYAGTARPSSGAWDIGAYEYITAPTPPQDLRILAP